MSKTILIVDDSVSMRKILGLTLAEQGYEILEADDGALALETLDGRTIDLIVSDLNMPNMNGLEFAHAVKKRKDYAFVPIVMLSTEGADKWKAESKAAGVRVWLTKPFQADELVSVISRLIA